MFSISWDDFAEKYDDEKLVNAEYFEPAITDENAKNSHWLIKGDNYPVLQKLQKEFCGTVDLIYIDPPYNTGNNFIYKDSFGKSCDRHSEWLSFMSRRLKLAKNLLSDSGCIFIAIDQSELYTLKLLCDQIFDEENFVNDFMWLHGKGKKDTWSRTLQQHTLCYARDKKKLKAFEEREYSSWATKNLDNDARGDWFSGSISFSETRSNPKHRNYFSITSPGGKVWTRQWQVSEEEMQSLIKDNRIYWGTEPDFSAVPRVKIFNNIQTAVIPKNIIDCVESTRGAQKHLDTLLGEKNVFDNPKPVDLISHLIEITQMKKDCLILDFFAGSGTTFEAVCKLNDLDGGNRRCILVQKPEEIKKSDSEFETIFDICRARCVKVGEKFGQKIWCAELIKG